MITNNPFSTLAEIVPSIAMQGFVIAMAALTLVGVLIDILHKKNVKYFFENAKKAKKNAQVELTTGKRTAVILKTVVHDIATTSELGWGKRRLAHVLGMYGTIIFWICSVILIFSYSSVGVETPSSLNDNFKDFWNNLFNDNIEEETFYKGIDEDTKTYVINRHNHFATLEGRPTI